MVNQKRITEQVQTAQISYSNSQSNENPNNLIISPNNYQIPNLPLSNLNDLGTHSGTLPNFTSLKNISNIPGVENYNFSSNNGPYYSGNQNFIPNLQVGNGNLKDIIPNSKDNFNKSYFNKFLKSSSDFLFGYNNDNEFPFSNLKAYYDFNKYSKFDHYAGLNVFGEVKLLNDEIKIFKDESLQVKFSNLTYDAGIYEEDGFYKLYANIFANINPKYELKDKNGNKILTYNGEHSYQNGRFINNDSLNLNIHKNKGNYDAYCKGNLNLIDGKISQNSFLEFNLKNQEENRKINANIKLISIENGEFVLNPDLETELKKLNRKGEFNLKENLFRNDLGSIENDLGINYKSSNGQIEFSELLRAIENEKLYSKFVFNYQKGDKSKFFKFGGNLERNDDGYFSDWFAKFKISKNLEDEKSLGLKGDIKYNNRNLPATYKCKVYFSKDLYDPFFNNGENDKYALYMKIKGDFIDIINEYILGGKLTYTIDENNYIRIKAEQSISRIGQLFGNKAEFSMKYYLKEENKKYYIDSLIRLYPNEKPQIGIKFGLELNF